MRETNIQVENFHFIDLLQVQIDKRPNEHPTACIIGRISDEDDAAVERSSAGQKVSITATARDGGRERVLFEGIAAEVGVSVENGVRILTVHGIGNTVFMDMERATRTCQVGSATYSEILSALGEDDRRFGFISPRYGSERIGRMLVQYEETDWEFCKRMASRLHTVVIPSGSLPSPYLSIGLPRGGARYEISPTHYKIRKDAIEYLELKENGVGLSERDAVYYEIETREIYELCDQVIFKGRPLYVYSVSSELRGAELYHTYVLKEESGFCSKEAFNQKLVGASLEGVVKAIDCDKVKIVIAGYWDQFKKKWFTYSTVYSSPDGTGWYFMPEEGDAVRLYFPSEHEDEAYVVSSTHVTHGSRSDPDTKFIRTVHGKEIIFKPKSIRITNGAGSSITLDDKDGIDIETSKQLRLTASDNITITGQGKVIVRGNKGVDVVQNDSEINIAENIDLTSGHTRMR